MGEAWFLQAGVLTCHGPLAAAAVFRRSICQDIEGDVAVSIDGDEKRAGQARFSMRSGGRHVVAESVDAGVFFEEHFFRRVLTRAGIGYDLGSMGGSLPLCGIRAYNQASIGRPDDQERSDGQERMANSGGAVGGGGCCSC